MLDCQKELPEIVTGASNITLFTFFVKEKANVVEKDFTEKNIRMYLNLGHSFGHGLETIIGLGKIAHGDAVAWGIGRALDLCVKKDFCTESYKSEVFKILKDYGWEISQIF